MISDFFLDGAVTPALPDEELRLIGEVQRLCTTRIAPRAEHTDRTSEFPAENLELLNGIGLNAIFIPEQYGGTPTTFTTYLLLVERISRACPSTAISWAATRHAVEPLLAFGSESHKRRYLKAIASGGLVAIAITEDQAGSDARAMRTSITPAPGGTIVINGRKRFITNGDLAAAIVVFGYMPGEPPRMTAVLVDRDTPGLTVGRREDKLGHRGSSTVELFFDQCVVPGDSVLGNPGDGFRVLVSALNMSRPSIAAEALGIACAAFDAAVSYTAGRHQFGHPILEFQGVQFMVADMAIKIACAQELLIGLGRLIDVSPGAEFDIQASILKVAASDAAMQVATDALQLHGGLGYTTETAISRIFRDAKLTQIWEGANELHRARIGSHFTKAARG